MRRKKIYGLLLMVAVLGSALLVSCASAPKIPQELLDELNAATAKAASARAKALDVQGDAYFPNEWRKAESDNDAGKKADKTKVDSINQAIASFNTAADEYDEIAKNSAPLYAKDLEDNRALLNAAMARAAKSRQTAQTNKGPAYFADEWDVVEANYQKLNPSIDADVEYSAHMANVGWGDYVSNGQTAGTTGEGRQIEAIKVRVKAKVSGSVQYDVHAANIGWMGWIADDEVAGTTGEGKQIEAIRVQLTGDLAKQYNIQYRVHMENVGWSEWIMNGQDAGTTGQGRQLEAVEIKFATLSGVTDTNTLSGIQATLALYTSAADTYDDISERSLARAELDAAIARADKSRQTAQNNQAPTFFPVEWNTAENIYNNVFADPTKVSYSVHMANVGWGDYASDGATAGTTGQKRQLEAIKVNVTSTVAGGVQYDVHAANVGWVGWIANDEVAGTTGEDRQIEAIRVQLTGDLAKKYNIRYRVHMANVGWSDWIMNGDDAGTTGQGRQLEAIEIKLAEKKSTELNYAVHMANIGWGGYVLDGETAGTTGQDRQLEAMKVRVNSNVAGNVQYDVHAANVGWMGWIANDQISGTTGEGKQIEAIRVQLTGALANQYNIRYRVHMANIGWSDWSMNGGDAGTTGEGRQIEAIEIKLVDKAEPALSYSVHMANVGWGDYAQNGETAGTTGQGRQLEAMKVRVNANVTGGIQYDVHASNVGWMGWIANDAVAGTTGEDRQLEAIRAQLTGNLANQFDLAYRVHMANAGWSEWILNGQDAGTTGQGRQIEAIEMKLVDKTPGVTDAVMPDRETLAGIKAASALYGSAATIYDDIGGKSAAMAKERDDANKALQAAMDRAAKSRQAAQAAKGPTIFPNEWKNAEDKNTAGTNAGKTTTDEIKAAAALFNGAADGYDDISKKALAQNKDMDDANKALQAAIARAQKSRQSAVDVKAADNFPNEWKAAETKNQSATSAKRSTVAEIKAATPLYNSAADAYDAIVKNGGSATSANAAKANADKARVAALDAKANVAVKDDFDKADALYQQATTDLNAKSFTSSTDKYNQSTAQFNAAAKAAQDKRTQAQNVIDRAHQKATESAAIAENAGITGGNQ